MRNLATMCSFSRNNSILMKRIVMFSLSLALVACGGESDQPTDELGSRAAEMPEIPVKPYPDTRKSDHIDDYHGTSVADPYVWLEDEWSDEVGAWVKAQQQYTEEYLSQVTYREAIRTRLTEIWNFEKQSAPSKEGDYTYWFKNDGIQNHAVMYRKKGEEGAEEIFLDPNTFSEDGTTALSGTYFSKDGKYCVYSISKAGSDWREFYVMDTETKELLPDHLEWIKFSGAAWYGNGFFYSAYNAPKEGQEFSQENAGQQLFYHQLGAEGPIPVHSDAANPDWSFSTQTFEEEQVAFMYTWASTSGNQLSFFDAQAWQTTNSSQGTLRPIIEGFDNDYNVVEIVDGRALIFTNEGASNYRLMAMDLSNPDRENWEEVLPEKEHVLESVTVVNGQLVVKYLENVQSKVYRYSLAGELLGSIELPGIGIVGGINGEMEDDHFYFSFVNYTRPSSIYRYNFSDNSVVLHFEPNIDFASDDFETKQVWYTSKDGTKIPMFITHKKGLTYDGNTPTFLFGYGGFNISYTPGFRLDRSVFLENGGIYAVANIRGGGEFGEEWHTAGTQADKQNVFDDFIGAAEYLIAEGYTNSEKLAIHGRSNGGLLVGACMTQRPDLFKVAVPKVGVLDMLKFHKFTIGRYWTVDYGCSDSASNFDYLIKYSPVHNVDSTAYPATIVVTGDHDDRVVPAHSYKFIAELQAKQTGDLPVLIRIDSDGGHGAGKPVSKQIAEFTDTWAFVFYHLGMEM